MKKLTLLALAAAASLANVCAQIPACDPSDQLVYVESAVTTDTATIIKLGFVHRPGERIGTDSLRLVGAATGKNYAMRSVDGFTFGKRVKIDETGCHSFTVVYDKVDDADSVVSLRSKYMGVRNVYLDGKHPAAKYVTKISGTYPKQETVIRIDKAAANVREMQGFWIPVHDGKFSFNLYADSVLAYTLADELGVIKGYWLNSGVVFSEGGDVVANFITTKDDEGDDRLDLELAASPGSLTAEYKEIREKIYAGIKASPLMVKYYSLKKNRALYTPEYYALDDERKAHPEAKDSLQKIANKLWEEDLMETAAHKEISAQISRWRKGGGQDSIAAAVAKDYPDLAGLFALQKYAWSGEGGKEVLVQTFQDYFEGKLPPNPYSDYFYSIGATRNPVEGNPYNDFTAPGLDGKQYTLSELIKGRPAVIDLWASWCGPCRRHSKELIPVYNEFADKGFTIVGVAREIDSTDAAEAAIENDGYPWLNLMEVNDANHIWAKYRADNAAGKVLLVSPEGIIVKVAPTAEEVRAYLRELYGNE